ncbi:DUF1385 domain-containing protein [bacterium]|nr:DUF1385 domain-containing protein [bacterium]
MRAEERESFAVGGQAVIEGVMMRGRDFVACAVRTPTGEIALKKEPFRSVLHRLKLTKVPILRGAIGLVETMVLGMRILSYSAEVAMPPAEPGKEKPRNGLKEKLGIGLTMVFAFVFGLGLFFYLPLVLTDLTPGTEGSLAFNVVDGIFRLAIFLLYIWAISLMRDMRRVFEYHGAEHKTINCYEQRRPLTPESILASARLHPRCGTSFLLLVMVVSILVFMPLGRPESVGERLLRIAFVPVIGGLSYELIKLSAQERWFRWLRPIVLPGLWLQRLTTREPDRDQCEVALRALSACLEPAELAALTPALEPDFSPPPLHYEEDEAESADDEETRPRREVNAE